MKYFLLILCLFTLPSNASLITQDVTIHPGSFGTVIYPSTTFRIDYSFGAFTSGDRLTINIDFGDAYFDILSDSINLTLAPIFDDMGGSFSNIRLASSSLFDNGASFLGGASSGRNIVGLSANPSSGFTGNLSGARFGELSVSGNLVGLSLFIFEGAVVRPLPASDVSSPQNVLLFFFAFYILVIIRSISHSAVISPPV